MLYWCDFVPPFTFSLTCFHSHKKCASLLNSSRDGCCHPTGKTKGKETNSTADGASGDEEVLDLVIQMVTDSDADSDDDLTPDERRRRKKQKDYFDTVAFGRHWHI